MNISPNKFELDLAGKKLTVETGLLATQATASVLASLGETVVLATVVLGREPKEGVDYMPLVVDYEERFYAAGKIFGSRFVKRESRPTDEAILSGRLIDRAVRPLFDQRIRNDIQIVITVLSIDGENDPDIVGLFAASCALHISNIPWNGPIGAVRIGLKQGAVLINPTYAEREQADLDMVVAGPKGLINMLEAQAKEVPEAKIAEFMDQCQQYQEQLIDFQDQIAKKIGSQKTHLILEEIPSDFKAQILDFLNGKIEPAIYVQNKKDRQEKWEVLTKEFKQWLENFVQGENEAEVRKKTNWAWEILEDQVSEITHNNIIKHDKRPDGRRVDELRSLSAYVSVLPRTHGSALFMRGETQALTSLTLGSPGDQQIIEGMELQIEKRFMHHYNFPPFSVGEIGRMRGPGRREIGHGALAEKALANLIPSKEQFPYTIRLVSEILSSNGSSSMASVCGSTLALMDGGVPIKAPAAGIAMGLMFQGENYKILTDIQGPEDHYGDMDLKSAGTEQGVTALQMDVKLDGVKTRVISEALEQAKKARLEILSVIKGTIATPRPDLSPLAPRIFTLQINPEKIGALIGTGGKNINEIIKETNTAIDIEDSGLVFVTAQNKESADEAIKRIKDLTRELKAGEEFVGRVVRLMDFGAFVELVPGMDGLLHVSELIPGYRIEKASDIVKLGQMIKVRIQKIDEQGKINLELIDPAEFESFKEKLGLSEGRASGKNSRPFNGSKAGHSNGKFNADKRHKRF